jgi:hypothetical protein
MTHRLLWRMSRGRHSQLLDQHGSRGIVPPTDQLASRLAGLIRPCHAGSRRHKLERLGAASLASNSAPVKCRGFFFARGDAKVPWRWRRRRGGGGDDGPARGLCICYRRRYGHLRLWRSVRSLCSSRRVCSLRSARARHHQPAKINPRADTTRIASTTGKKLIRH